MINLIVIVGKEEDDILNKIIGIADQVEKQETKLKNEESSSSDSSFFSNDYSEDNESVSSHLLTHREKLPDINLIVPIDEDEKEEEKRSSFSISVAKPNPEGDNLLAVKSESASSFNSNSNSTKTEEVKKKALKTRK